MVPRDPLAQPFLCPLCGSNEYAYVVFPRKDGSAYVTRLYRCCGCTIAFTDPERLAGLYRSTFDRDRNWREVRRTRELDNAGSKTVANDGTSGEGPMGVTEILPKIVFGVQVETLPELGGIALKFTHSLGPNASYSLTQLESHFAMPRAFAMQLRDALDKMLPNLPPGPLNS